MDTLQQEIDPVIPLDFALEQVGGNQSELARRLNIERASVSDWKRRGLENLPPLQAHRFVRVFGVTPKRAA